MSSFLSSFLPLSLDINPISSKRVFNAPFAVESLARLLMPSANVSDLSLEPVDAFIANIFFPMELDRFCMKLSAKPSKNEGGRYFETSSGTESAI